MVYWEYRTERRPKIFFNNLGNVEVFLDTLGDDRWELIHLGEEVFEGHTSYLFVFKRPQD